MNHADAPSQSGGHSASSSASDTRLHGGLLVLARGVWIAMVALTLGLFIASLPMLSRQLQTVCVSATSCPDGHLGPTGLQTIHDLGFSVGGYAAYMLTLFTATSLVWFAVGLIIFWRKSDDWMALLVALFLVMCNIFPGVGKSLPAFVYPDWDPPLKFLSFLAVIPLGLFFYLFPSGKFVPRWTGRLAVALFALALLRFFFPNSPFDFTTWPDGLNVLTFLSLAGTMLFAQVYRYRRVSDAMQRQQTRWVVFGVTTALVVPMLGALYYLLFPALSQSGSRFSFFFTTTMPIVLLAVPLSIGIAILRYRLWDIDIIIQRTLVYAALSACVIGLYVLVVVGLGSLLQAQGNLILSLVATGLIAILFQPLRQRVQQAVNRLLYGERDEPYRVLARLDQQIAQAMPPEDVLPALVKTIASTLKLPYVAVALVQSTASGLSEERLVAVRGQPSSQAPTQRLPIVYQGETVGQLMLASRSGEAQLTRADRRLLEDMARHAGVIVHAVHLTADLRRSRERLVLAREEERRRLRRDLHDGLGPQLSSQTFTLSAIKKLLRQDPDTAEHLLTDAITHAQEAIADIRRLVYALRPPALDDLGLLAALQEQMTQYHASGILLTLDAPETLPTLPAASEMACYRIVQEALTNVVRHAHATSATVHLHVQEALVVEVRDNGQGLPPGVRSGVGFSSMRERAEELGGTYLVEALAKGGTRVCARLPLLVGQHEENEAAQQEEGVR